MGASMIPVNAWMHLESFEVFIFAFSFCFFRFVSREPCLSSWACISFLSRSCFIDIDNTPQCLQILFFSVCLLHGLLSYDLTCT
jgi:hypothetical protein